jgi:SynChlorMet cassette radical SAM/SPASM protein ScmE
MAALNDLSTEQWLDVFGKLRALGVMDATLTGGEALTRPDFFELVDGIIANRMRYSILSNGTLFTETLIDKFREGKRLQRLDSIQISIDGSCARVHDSHRPHSFERALRGLRLLNAQGFPLTVRVTIHPDNVEDLEATARLLLEDVGLPSFSTNEAFPMGAGCGNEGNTCLSPVRQMEAMRVIARLEERYPGRVAGQAGPLAKRRMFAEMESARAAGHKSSRWGMGFLTACGCVFSHVDILHDGSIVPCVILHRLVLGNVLTDDLGEIWRGHPTLKALRDRRAIPMRDVPGCGDCEWAEFCNGSCPGLAHELTGDFNRANPADCYRSFREHTGGIHAL